MSSKQYKKMASLKNAEEFTSYVKELGIDLGLAPAVASGSSSPLGSPYKYKDTVIGNRWCILPMEGWDCLPDGSPGELTERRWIRFGQSGAKLLFGCEAAAVMPSGKSNTRQMMINEQSVGNIAALREKMVAAHIEKYGTADDLYVGLQLTHSGRYSHPNDDAVLESVTAYSNPLLDKKFGNGPENVVSDEEVENIITHFITAAKLAQQAGFDFVDIKHAHGYLGHEFLSAFDRPGPFWRFV